jgi:hypothetical protein
MDGVFTHRSVEIQWTFVEDGDYDDGSRWVFRVRLGDISVTRRYPDPISQDEAEAEARSIASELFRIAEQWLSSETERDVS